MRKTVALVALVLFAAPALAQSKLNVIATTEDLAAIAREVGGDRITVEALARGYQDPHFVEAKPSFILKLQKADVLIANSATSIPVDPLPNILLWNSTVKGKINDQPVLGPFWNANTWTLKG